MAIIMARPRRAPAQQSALDLRIDADWLQAQLDAIGETQTGLALRKYPGQKNWINKIVLGERRLQIDEATWLADQFSATLDDVLSGFGYHLPPPPSVPVTGIAKAGGIVAPVDPGATAPAPPGASKDMRAILVDEDCPVFGLYRNAFLYYIPETGVKMWHSGRLCAVEIGAAPRLVWGRPAGGENGKDRIDTGAEPIYTQRSVSTSLVLWIKTA